MHLPTNGSKKPSRIVRSYNVTPKPQTYCASCPAPNTRQLAVRIRRRMEFFDVIVRSAKSVSLGIFKRVSRLSRLMDVPGMLSVISLVTALMSCISLYAISATQKLNWERQTILETARTTTGRGAGRAGALIFLIITCSIAKDPHFGSPCFVCMSSWLAVTMTNSSI